MFRAPLRWIKSWIYFALCVPRVWQSVERYFFPFEVLLFIYFVALFFFLFYLVVVHVLLPRCSVWRLFFWAFFKVTVLPQSLLSFTHIFRFRLHLSSLYRVLFFLYLVDMHLVFWFLHCNPVCAFFFLRFIHVSCLLFLPCPSPACLLDKIVFCSADSPWVSAEKAWDTQDAE